MKVFAIKRRNRCKLVCMLFPPLRPGYADGRKYCSRCEKFIVTDRKHCECCGCQLRTKPVDINLPQKRKKDVPRALR